MTDPYPNLLIEHIGDITVVTLKPGDFFDQQMIAIAKRELLDMVKAEQPTKLILSFKNIQRFSSAFIGILVGLKEHLRFHHPEAEMKLADLRPAHREVFRLVDPNQTLFKLYEAVPNAYEAFRAGAV
ncbi:MAG: STAS domain-containing protein [Pirellulaceae bacterium]|jgi:anti-anti-sigma regulatory factor|nr:STAS domain-containing protein [Pirellulaceae bacterium]MCU0978696.1 STAS domain-containing protein [Pirellulaceae bacterium]